jgi:hypothetical protein
MAVFRELSLLPMRCHSATFALMHVDKRNASSRNGRPCDLRNLIARIINQMVEGK